MVQALTATSDTYHPDNTAWLLIYGSVGVLLALPTIYVAFRRGFWPAFLAGVATYVGLALLGLAVLIMLVAIDGGSQFAIGFGELILLELLTIFMAPAIVVGVALAVVLRRFSHRQAPPSRPRPTG